LNNTDEIDEHYSNDQLLDDQPPDNNLIDNHSLNAQPVEVDKNFDNEEDNTMYVHEVIQAFKQ
jgi:hypothetical protein